MVVERRYISLGPDICAYGVYSFFLRSQMTGVLMRCILVFLLLLLLDVLNPKEKGNTLLS